MNKKEELDLTWLAQYRTGQPHFGLKRMEFMLDLRGNPHLQVPIIHIAGTNGKGSTIAYLTQLLRSCGLKVGTFTSPYLVTYNEQIAIDGKAISNRALHRLLAEYQVLFEIQKEKDLQGVTEFELLTVIAYDYFAQEEVDVALIEVGMGGRLDSTNVCRPILTGITTIAFDHVALLGDSLSAIAKEKAGIIKAGVPLVTGNIVAEALAVIEEIAQEKKVHQSVYKRDYQVVHQDSAQHDEVFTFRNRWRKNETYHTSLLGLHQVTNAALAIELCDHFCQLQHIPLLSEVDIQRAFSQTRWAGRMEVLSECPFVMIDGAHNVQAMEMLKESLDRYYGDKKKQVLFSCIQTKALDEMIAVLKDVSDCQLFLTTFEDARSVSKKTMQELAKREQLTVVTWQEYLEDYLRHPEKQADLLVITGSLYFLLQVREEMLKRLEELKKNG